MNAVMHYLARNRERLARELPALEDEALSCVLLTPRFRASSHVVCLVVGARSAAPLLVAKLARLPGDAPTSRREAANLCAAQRGRPGGFASIPRVLACEPLAGHMLLLETALPGLRIDPDALRAQPQRHVAAVVDWLIEFQLAQRDARGAAAETLAAPVDATLALLRVGLGADGDARPSIERTAKITEPLRAGLAAVFEHGDLSHPNLLELPSGGVGVLDWELAEPQGLPGHDLFFFLAYVATKLARADSLERQRRALDEAFFGQPVAWVQDAVDRYARCMELPREALRPLFALSFARSVASFVARLGAHQGCGDHQTTRWIRGDRHHAFWQHTLSHYAALRL